MYLVASLDLRRLLASLALLPEVLALHAPGAPCPALCLARLSGVRYTRDALVDQETAAAWPRNGEEQEIRN